MKNKTSRQKFFRQVFVLFVIVFFSMPGFFLFRPAPVLAAPQKGEPLPAGVDQSLELLINAVQAKSSPTMEDLIPLLHFARNTALNSQDWNVGSLHEATGAYFGYTIDSPVERIVDYLYHPGLPSSLFHPSVVRIGTWQEEPQADIPMLWKELKEREIHAMYGKETEENTPDTTTGGYYRYDTDRLLLLLKQEGNKFLISVSKQIDQSSVGRKGVVLGEDTDWNYYYADEEGLTKNGLGWVNSYIFDSFSITVLCTNPQNPTQSQHVMFKWVRAGWSGMNMVRTGHVRDGCMRFAQSLTKLMESPRLPDIDTVVRMADHVATMDQAKLNQTLEPYVQQLRLLSQNDPVLSRRSFRTAMENDPLAHYTREAKQSLIMKEFIKASIGMPVLLTRFEDILPKVARYAGNKQNQLP